METRARRAVCERASALPQEVWQLIVSFLAPPEAVRAALVCSDFAAVSTPAAHQACKRLWPQHTHRLALCGASGVQRFLRLVQAHEEELAAHPDVAKARAVQKTVCPEHRQIAVEWLIEVSWDWQLESTVVYRGAQYLDHYLATHAVPALSKFQMLAISCLRTALKHSSKLAERERQRLPCKHWAEVTDGACTEAEVRSTCTKLERMLHAPQRSHPNAKQRLRYLWYRLYDAGTVKQEHVYIYMLASFLLHLSLLDSALSAVTPTKLATAALSMSLKVFGFPPMPPVLEEHCFYLEAELQEVAQLLERAQEEVVGQQLRALWVQSYSYVGTNPSQQPAYSTLQQIVSSCGKLSYMPANDEAVSPESNDAARTGAASTTPAAAPASAAAAAAALPEAAAGDGGASVNRVMTRAAAAAGLASSQRQQHTPASVPPAAVAAAAAAAAAGATTADHNPSSRTAGAGSSHGASSSRVAYAAALPYDADQGLALATPQRPAAVNSVPLVPVIGPMPNFAAAVAAAAGPSGTLATPPAATLVAAAAGPEPHTGGHHHQQMQQPGSASGGSARRCPTRELPPRRAVAVSRYGMLASRGGTPVAAPLHSGDGPSSSRAAAGHMHQSSGGSGGGALAAGGAGAGSSSHPHQRPSGLVVPGSMGAAGTSEGVAAGAAAGAGPSSSGLWGGAAGGAGPSTSNAARPWAAAAVAGAAPHVPAAGSMTPASPKHAAAGTRGLAALFAGVGHGNGAGGHGNGGAGGHGSSGSHAGSGSNTGRLLSGLPSLQNKLSAGDAAELHDRLASGADDAHHPAWLWSIQQLEAGGGGAGGGTSSYGSSHAEGSSKGSVAGPGGSSNNVNNNSLHMASVPVLRSTRRAAAAAAAAASGVCPGSSEGGVGASGASSHHQHQQLHHQKAGYERPGVHTRSSSGGDGGSSHWHAVAVAPPRAVHHPIHHRE